MARPNRATCSGQNQYGENIEVTATGQLARCLQHETDHLNGVVFGDRLSSRRRRALYRTHEQVAAYYPDNWPITSV